MDYNSFLYHLNDLKHCDLCPRNCGADRFSEKKGFCNTGVEFLVSSIVVHRGEEPVIGGIKGICNVFFSHCNLQCCYCQNFQISRNNFKNKNDFHDLKSLIEKIIAILDSGIDALGFVSPSHMVQQMLVIIDILHYKNYFPTIVYNSGGYDKVSTLKKLEPIVDVYLPDFKYLDKNIAKNYSLASDYPEVASAAIYEMFRQKGSTVICNDDGRAVFGLIIRHLVLPGNIENSKNILRFIANQLSPKVYVSLMSQYFPANNVKNHPDLGRYLTKNEYDEVIEEMINLGFSNGFVQEIESSENYLPDFDKLHPFEY